MKPMSNSAKLKQFILIDAKEQRVSTLLGDPLKDDWLDTLYTALDCQTIEGCSWGFHSLTVDEEGLFDESKVFVYLNGYPQPIAGNVIIHTIDDDGYMDSCLFSHQKIRENVAFGPRESVSMVMSLKNRNFEKVKKFLTQNFPELN